MSFTHEVMIQDRDNLMADFFYPYPLNSWTGGRYLSLRTFDIKKLLRLDQLVDKMAHCART